MWENILDSFKIIFQISWEGGGLLTPPTITTRRVRVLLSQLRRSRYILWGRCRRSGRKVGVKNFLLASSTLPLHFRKIKITLRCSPPTTFHPNGKISYNPVTLGPMHNRSFVHLPWWSQRSLVIWPWWWSVPVLWGTDSLGTSKRYLSNSRFFSKIIKCPSPFRKFGEVLITILSLQTMVATLRLQKIQKVKDIHILVCIGIIYESLDEVYSYVNLLKLKNFTSVIRTPTLIHISFSRRWSPECRNGLSFCRLWRLFIDIVTCYD